MPSSSPPPHPQAAPLVLSRQEQENLRTYAHELAATAIKEVCAATPNPEWQQYGLLKKHKHMKVFKQNTSTATASHEPNLFTRARSAAANHGLYAAAASPNFMARGSFPGDLREVLYGLLAVDDAGLALQQSTLFERVGSRMQQRILCSIETPSRAKPLKYVGVKWMSYQMFAMKQLVRPRDFVFLESIGTMKRNRRASSVPSAGTCRSSSTTNNTNGTGHVNRRSEELWETEQVTPCRDDEDSGEEEEHEDPEIEEIGFHLIHSIRLPNCPEQSDKEMTRGMFSICYVYRQRNPRVPTQSKMVDVYVKCFMNPRGGCTGGVLEKMANHMLSDLLIDGPQTLTVSRLKKIQFFIRQPPPEVPSEDTECAICMKRVFRKGTCTICRRRVCTKCRHWVRIATATSSPSTASQPQQSQPVHGGYDRLDDLEDSESSEDEQDHHQHQLQLENSQRSSEFIYAKKAFCATCVYRVNRFDCMEAAIDDAMLKEDRAKSETQQQTKQFVTGLDQKRERQRSRIHSLALQKSYDKLRLRDSVFSFDPYMQSYEDLSDLVEYQKDVGPYVDFHLQNFKFDRKKSRLVALRRVPCRGPRRRSIAAVAPVSKSKDTNNNRSSLSSRTWGETIPERKPAQDPVREPRRSSGVYAAEVSYPLKERQSYPASPRQELLARMCELQNLADQAFCITQETTRRYQELMRNSDLAKRADIA